MRFHSNLAQQPIVHHDRAATIDAAVAGQFELVFGAFAWQKKRQQLRFFWFLFRRRAVVGIIVARRVTIDAQHLSQCLCLACGATVDRRCPGQSQLRFDRSAEPFARPTWREGLQTHELKAHDALRSSEILFNALAGSLENIREDSGMLRFVCGQRNGRTEANYEREDSHAGSYTTANEGYMSRIWMAEVFPRATTALTIFVNTPRMAASALAIALAVTAVAPLRAETADERLREAAVVFKEIMAAPDQGIPTDLLGSAYCVVVVPGVKKAALIVGGKYGRGFAVCRTDNHASWRAPAAVRMEGGSFGFQIGASETDVVMVVMDQRGMDSILSSKFTLGGSADVAAGPVGRSTTAETDAAMRAKILSYSRSRGVFAGLALSGATLRQDLDENKELYGKPLTNKEIVTGNQTPSAGAGELLALLEKYSHKP